MDSIRRHLLRQVRLVDLTDSQRIVKVVGESWHQGDLFAINGGWLSDEEDIDPSRRAEPDSVAELALARLKRYPRAVAIRIKGRPVGYLAKEDADLYWSVIREIERDKHRAICLSRIVGGYVLEDGTRAYFGAELFLCSPEDVPHRKPTATARAWPSQRP